MPARCCTAPLIEVHISNVHRPRAGSGGVSHVSTHATGVIVGLGVEGYVLALSWLSASAGDSTTGTGVRVATTQDE